MCMNIYTSQTKIHTYAQHLQYNVKVCVCVYNRQERQK